MNFEEHYKQLVRDVIGEGERRQTRNAFTFATCFKTLTIDSLRYGVFPLLTGRKMYPDGIIGEFAAFMHRPKKLTDFTSRNCNYWNKWADEMGNINIDYGNAWLNWAGINQLQDVINTLRCDPHDRRMIVTGWDPGALKELSLPCCHILYQFVVTGGKVNLIWYQRSADVMIGVPSDMVLAALLLIYVADAAGRPPGNINMVFGDAHMYEDHLAGAREYLNRSIPAHPTYEFDGELFDFEPHNFKINDYNPKSQIKFKLHG